ADHIHAARRERGDCAGAIAGMDFCDAREDAVSSSLSYFLNGAIAKAKYGSANEMNFEAPLTSLVWLTSIVSIGLTYLISYFIIPTLGADGSQWWKLSTIISCGTLAGALIPELVKVFTSVESRHVKE